MVQRNEKQGKVNKEKSNVCPRVGADKLLPQRLDLLMELGDLYEVLAPTQSNHHLMISIENL